MSSMRGTQNQSKNKRQNRNRPPDWVKLPILLKSCASAKKTMSYNLVNPGAVVT